MKKSSEEWRNIPGYDGLYMVSNIGRVKSLREKTRIMDKDTNIMHQKTDNNGYLRVNLCKDNVCKARLVSRLVAEAFVPNPDNLPHVGHNDDIKTNNNSQNLYWTNPSENNRHNGKLERFHEEHQNKIDIIAKKLSVPVRAIALDGSHEMTFDSTQEASRHGFNSGKISLCINNKRNSHKGYRWERIN